MMSFTTQSNMARRIKTPLVILFYLFIWELGALKVSSSLILPSPVETIEALLELMPKEVFRLSVATTVVRIVSGVGLSMVAGIFLGIASSMKKQIFYIIEPLVGFLKSIPVISVSILILLWFDENIAPVAVCFLLCFPPIWSNTFQGMNTVDKKKIEMARVYQVEWIDILKNIYLPHLSPYMLSGLSISIGLGWKSTVTAELLSSAPYAMGRMIYNSKIYLETTDLFAWTMTVVILSMFMEKIVKCLIEKKSRRIRDGHKN